MRLVRLDLAAFGPFTDVVLDLGRADFNVVYGDNEAGKSTSMRAVEALLYGFPHVTPDDHLHSARDLRVGATVESSAGVQLHFRRRKGRKDTLLDPSDRALDDLALAPFLGPVTHEQFRAIFALSRDDLQRGGEHLLAGQGDLGESLFGAGLGTSDVHRLLLDLQNEGSALFKPSAQNPRINARLSEHRVAIAESKAAMLKGADWDRARDAMEEAEKRLAELTERITTTRVGHRRLERLSGVLPLIAERGDLVGRLSALEPVPDLPRDAAAERREAVTALKGSEEAIQRLEQRLAEQQPRLAELSVREDVLDHALEIAALQERKGEINKGRVDLPRLRADADQSQERARRLSRELTLGDDLQRAGNALPSEPSRERLLALADDALGAKRDARDATEARQATERRLASALEEQGDEPGEVPEELHHSLAAARSLGEVEAQVGALCADLATADGDCRFVAAALGLGDRTLAEAEGLPVPSAATVERFAAEREELDRDDDGLQRRVAELSERRTSLQRQLDEARIGGDVPCEAQLATARSVRQRGWTLVRGTWLGGGTPAEEIDAYCGGRRDLATAFEEAVSRADDVADSLRREADRAAMVATLQLGLDAADTSLAALEATRAQTTNRRAAHDDAWGECWAGLGVALLPPREMAMWLSRHEKLVEGCQAARKRRMQLTGLEERVEQCRAALSSALGRTETIEALPILLRRGDQTIEAHRGEHRRWADGKRRTALERSALEAAAHRESTAVGALESWQASWAVAVARFGLRPEASMSEARAAVDRVRELERTLDELQQIERRVVGIQRDSGIYEEAVRRVAGPLVPELDHGSADDCVSALATLLAQATRDQAAARELSHAVEGAQSELDEARRRKGDAEQELERLLRRGACADVEALIRAEEIAATRRDLQEAMAACERAMTQAGAASVEELQTACVGLDPDDTRAQVERLARLCDELEAERENASMSVGELRRDFEAMDGSDLGAVAVDRAQVLAAGIREDAERYAVVQLAGTLLREAIDRYRAENQGPLVARARNLFPRLTMGRYTGLRVGYGADDRPVLEGIRCDGRCVPVSCMSDGTRDQLYLALRLATVERHAAAHEPLPLVLDDLLLNFDDDRARAALEVLGELAATTQILFFTHHRHLVQLVEETLNASTVAVHDLSELVAAA